MFTILLNTRLHFKRPLTYHEQRVLTIYMLHLKFKINHSNHIYNNLKQFKIISDWVNLQKLLFKRNFNDLSGQLLLVQNLLQKQHDCAALHGNILDTNWLWINFNCEFCRIDLFILFLKLNFGFEVELWDKVQ